MSFVFKFCKISVRLTAIIKSIFLIRDPENITAEIFQPTVCLFLLCFYNWMLNTIEALMHCRTDQFY